MSTSLPTTVDLCRRRGDTYADEFVIKDSAGVVVNITGFSFKMAVDPSPEPADATANLFVLTGTITDGPNGIVEFAPSLAQSDQTASEYYYDLQQTDGGGLIRTIAVGKYEFLQDVSK